MRLALRLFAGLLVLSGAWLSGCATGNTRLPPIAQAAEENGLDAAKRGDFKKAIAEIDKARQSACFDPVLMYDLALADERAGKKAAASLWWRAYLTADPSAPNAKAVSAEVDRLADELEARARQRYRQAVALALNLSSAPIVAGGKSLRERAFQAILDHASFFGPADMVGAISKSAWAGMPHSPKAKPLTGDGSRGLWGLTRALSIKRAVLVRGLHGHPGHNPVRDGMMAQMLARMGDSSDAMTWLSHDYGPSLIQAGAASVVIPALSRARALDSAAKLLKRLIVVNPFSLDVDGDLVGVSLQAFWSGRRDLARKLAYDSMGYCEFFPLQGTARMHAYGTNGPTMVIAAALAGYWDAVETFLRANGHVFDWGRWLVTDRVAGIVAATAGKRALELIPRIYEELVYWETPWTPKRPGPDSPIVKKFHRENPMGDFDLDLVKGDDDSALDMIDDWAEDPTRVEGRIDHPMWLDDALDVAVAMNKPEVALAAARANPDGEEVTVQLGLLRRHADADTRASIDVILRQIRGGRAPLSPTRKGVLLGEIELAEEVQYSYDSSHIVPEDLEEQAKTGDPNVFSWEAPKISKQLAAIEKKTPELLPSALSLYGSVDYMVSVAARGPEWKYK